MDKAINNRKCGLQHEEGTKQRGLEPTGILHDSLAFHNFRQLTQARSQHSTRGALQMCQSKVGVLVATPIILTLDRCNVLKND